MLKFLYPNEYIDSTYEIDFQKIYDKGIRGIIFDIDNTLVPHGAPADERAAELFQRLKDIGLKTCVVSNNHEPRVRSFCEKVGSPYVFKAGKPKGRGYLRGMHRMGTDLNHTICIGDQIFTDIWGARMAGLYSIMVGIIEPDYEIQIILKRKLEKPVMYLYRKYIKNHGNENGYRHLVL